MNNTVKRSRKITGFAMIAAVIFVGVIIDTVISGVFPIRPAFASLMTLVTVCLIFGWAEALFAGGFFGILSLVRAYIYPNLTSSVFIYPEVSVLPRIAVGIVIWGSMILLKKICKKSDKPFVSTKLPYHIAGGLGVVTNTTLVISAMGLHDVDVIATVIKTVTGALFPIELVIGALVAPMVAIGVSRAIGGNK